MREVGASQKDRVWRGVGGLEGNGSGKISRFLVCGWYCAKQTGKITIGRMKWIIGGQFYAILKVAFAFSPCFIPRSFKLA